MSNPSAKVYTGEFDQFASAIILDAVIFLAIGLTFVILRLFQKNEFFFAPQYFDRCVRSAASGVLCGLTFH